MYHDRDSWRFNAPTTEAPTLKDEKKPGGDGGRLMLRMWISPWETRELPATERYKLCWGETDANKPRGGLTPKRKELTEAVNSGKVPSQVWD